MNRRNFLKGILAAGIAPAIVKAANIMPVRQISDTGIVQPELIKEEIERVIRMLSKNHVQPYNGNYVMHYYDGQTFHQKELTPQDIYVP